MSTAKSIARETAMYTPQHQPHYAPSSVGALMDPVFLRQAVNDADEQGFARESAPTVDPARWRAAVRVAFNVCLHRLSWH